MTHEWNKNLCIHWYKLKLKFQFVWPDNMYIGGFQEGTFGLQPSNSPPYVNTFLNVPCLSHTYHYSHWPGDLMGICCFWGSSPSPLPALPPVSHSPGPSSQLSSAVAPSSSVLWPASALLTWPVFPVFSPPLYCSCLLWLFGSQHCPRKKNSYQFVLIDRMLIYTV